MTDKDKPKERDRPVAKPAAVICFPSLGTARRRSDKLERIDLFRIYQLGADLHPIGDLPEKVTANVLFSPLFGAKAAIATLLQPDAPARIELARPAAIELQRLIERLYQEIFTDANGAFKFPGQDIEISHYQLWPIKEAMRSFEAVFRAEMQAAATYRVPKKGIYDTGYLVDKSSDAFPSVLLPHIGKIAMDEYMEAGRCYAFGLYTASGYHSCRAAEAVLRQYYRFFTSKTDDGSENWGKLTNELLGGKNGGKPAPDAKPLAPSKTMDQIIHLRDHSRNPISHLRSVLDEKDADELLSRAKVVIMSMANDIMERNEAVEPSLQLVPPNDEAAA